MYTITPKKQEIISHLNLVPESRLNEIDLFIRFILSDSKEITTKTIGEEKTKETDDDFFSVCGMWQNRDIDTSGLRQKAWRKLQW